MSFVFISPVYMEYSELQKKYFNKPCTNLEFLTVNILLHKLEESTAVENVIFLNLSISAIDYRHIPFSSVTSGTTLIYMQAQHLPIRHNLNL